MGKVKEMVMDQPQYNRSNPRFKLGQFHQHKKHGFVIQLIGRGQWGRWAFKVIKGEIPSDCRPEHADNSVLSKYTAHNNFKLDFSVPYYVYSRDSLYQSFNCISGKGAEVLFASRKE